MTTQADIKLVIDQLDKLDLGFLETKVVHNAATTLETLGNQVAKQAAVIEKLRDALEFYANPASDTFGNTARKALALPTDSKQILQEWLDSVLGEPVAYTNETELSYARYTRSDGELTHGAFWKNYDEDSEIPLVKKPEILK